jgi:hypothetical protein
VSSVFQLFLHHALKSPQQPPRSQRSTRALALVAANTEKCKEGTDGRSYLSWITRCWVHLISPDRFADSVGSEVPSDSETEKREITSDSATIRHAD